MGQRRLRRAVGVAQTGLESAVSPLPGSGSSIQMYWLKSFTARIAPAR
jgi:hypothetical protein